MGEWSNGRTDGQLTDREAERQTDSMTDRLVDIHGNSAPKHDSASPDIAKKMIQNTGLSHQAPTHLTSSESISSLQKRIKALKPLKTGFKEEKY